jgi:hypothetical protein
MLYVEGCKNICWDKLKSKLLEYFKKIRLCNCAQSLPKQINGQE